MRLVNTVPIASQTLREEARADPKMMRADIRELRVEMRDLRSTIRVLDLQEQANFHTLRNDIQEVRRLFLKAIDELAALRDDCRSHTHE